jgi:hypothetical protein
MSKMIDATCVGGVVTAEGVPVSVATILSEGVGASTGVLILDEAKTSYIAKTSPDLKTTLEKLSSALTAIASALTAIDGKALGTLPPVPAATSTIATITSLQGDIATLKGALK